MGSEVPCKSIVIIMKAGLDFRQSAVYYFNLTNWSRCPLFEDESLAGMDLHFSDSVRPIQSEPMIVLAPGKRACEPNERATRESEETEETQQSHAFQGLTVERSSTDGRGSL